MKMFAKKRVCPNPFRIYFKNGSVGVDVVQSEIKTDKMRYSAEEDEEDDDYVDAKKMNTGPKPIWRLRAQTRRASSKQVFIYTAHKLFVFMEMVE